MLVTKKSQFSGKQHTREIPINLPQYQEWIESGQFVQDAFRQLSADDREFLITGVTPEEWVEAFPPEEYEDDPSSWDSLPF